MPLTITVTHAELLAAKGVIDHVLDVVEEYGDGQDHMRAEPLRALLPKLKAYLAAAPGATPQSSVTVLVKESLFTLQPDELLRRQRFTPDTLGKSRSLLKNPEANLPDEDWFSGTGRE